jgi:hypothetical protein
MAKEVSSDLKDVRPGDIVPPHKERRGPSEPGDRSDHVPHAITRGDPEQHGGIERSERRGESAIAPARGRGRHNNARPH